MAVKLFVGGLSFSPRDEGLGHAFAKYGTVASAQAVRGPDGRSRGFGNNTSLDGRTITVERAGAPARPPRRAAGPTRW